MISGFYRLSVAERRLRLLRDDFDENDLNHLCGTIDDETAQLDLMSENVVGALRLPMGILTGLLVNGTEHIVPMATEEPSVVAAVNRTARLINAAGGIKTEVMRPVTTAQIMLVADGLDAEMLKARIIADKSMWLLLANRCDEKLIQLGGGAFDLDAEVLPGNETWAETFVVTRIHVHTLDAMGANIVNTMAECILREMVKKYQSEPVFATIEPGMAILTNMSLGRMVTASALIPFEVISAFGGTDGEAFAHLIARSSAFATRSPERAITHNKGILNGMIAAALAFGQDTRALGSAALAYACHREHRPLASWSIEAQGLCGQIALPVVAGFVGGAQACPQYRAALRLSRIDSYHTLCSVLAGVGLAQNLGALWALSTDGIQAGHMKLHRRKEAERKTAPEAL